MEQKLDDVEIGKEQWQKVIDGFSQPFKVELSKAEEQMEKIQIKDEPAGFDCAMSVDMKWLLNLDVLENSMHVAISQICSNTKQITKEIGVTLSCLPKRASNYEHKS